MSKASVKSSDYNIHFFGSNPCLYFIIILDANSDSLQPSRQFVDTAMCPAVKLYCYYSTSKQEME